MRCDRQPQLHLNPVRVLQRHEGGVAQRAYRLRNVGELVALCVAENDRRLAPFDARLKRPRFVPFMARLALKFIGPKKAKAS